MKTMVRGPDAATLFWDGLAEELSAIALFVVIRRSSENSHMRANDGPFIVRHSSLVFTAIRVYDVGTVDGTALTDET